MLRPITTSSASARSAPSSVQASAAANLSANGAQATTVAAAESARTQTGASSAEQMFRYNSFQFIYRQDIGRIVLIGQSPETGERVIQEIGRASCRKEGGARWTASPLEYEREDKREGIG